MTETTDSPLLQTAEAHHQKIKGQSKGSAIDALSAGNALLAAKAATPGKRWLAVLKRTTSMNPRTVQRYMMLARAKEAGMLDENVNEMSFTEAYRLAVRQALRVARRSDAAAAGSEASAPATHE